MNKPKYEYDPEDHRDEILAPKTVEAVKRQERIDLEAQWAMPAREPRQNPRAQKMRPQKGGLDP